MSSKKVIKLPIKKTSMVLKVAKLVLILTALAFLTSSAALVYSAYRERVELSKPLFSPNTCWLDSKEFILYQITGVKDGHYQVKFLRLFTPHLQEARISYLKFNKDQKEKKIREVPCGN